MKFWILMKQTKNPLKISIGSDKLLTLSKAGGGFTIHFNKAQSGASPWAVEELDKTPMHPSIKGISNCALLGTL